MTPYALMKSEDGINRNIINLTQETTATSINIHKLSVIFTGGP